MEQVVDFNLDQFIKNFETSNLSACSVKCFDKSGEIIILELNKDTWSRTYVNIFSQYGLSKICAFEYSFDKIINEVRNSSDFNELIKFSENNLNTYYINFYKFVDVNDILKIVLDNTEKIFEKESSLFNEFGIFTQDSFCTTFNTVEAFGLIIKSFSYTKPTGDIKWGNYFHEISADTKFVGMHNKPVFKIDVSRGDYYKREFIGLNQYCLGDSEKEVFKKNYYASKDCICINFDEIQTNDFSQLYIKSEKINFDSKIFKPVIERDSFILSRFHWVVDYF